MGFLDRKSRVVDFILTERGRKLYAVGRLEFVYFSLMDDGIDYDPYMTGSITETDRDTQVVTLPMWEAPFVRDVRASTAPLEPTSHLFVAADGYRLVPFMSSPPSGSSVEILADQLQRGAIFRRSGTNHAQIDLKLRGQGESQNPGFIVRVFESGSQGLTELFARDDLRGRRSFDPFLSAVIDSETAHDVPTTDRPSSYRTRISVLGPGIRSTIGRR